MARWIKTTLIGLLAVTWLAASAIYLSSMGTIERQHTPEVRNLSAVTDPDDLEEGERLARVLGCAGACHGDRMEGQVLYAHPLDGQLVAPNLTRSASTLTLPELEAIVRQGIRPDGTTVFGMPSSSLGALTDADLSAVLSYIRQAPVQVENPGRHDFGLFSRFRIVTGDLRAEADERLGQNPWRETFRSNEARLGEYLSTVACGQCHGLDLDGGPDGAPSLDALKDYDRFEFVALMREGLAPGEQEVGLMTETATARFIHLTDQEINALYVYLKTRD